MKQKKILYLKNLDEIINKYKLEKQTTDKFGDAIEYEFYKNSIYVDDFTEKVITLENEESYNYGNGKTLFLIVEHIYFDKLTEDDIPTSTRRVTQIELI